MCSSDLISSLEMRLQFRFDGLNSELCYVYFTVVSRFAAEKLVHTVCLMSYLTFTILLTPQPIRLFCLHRLSDTSSELLNLKF